MLFRYIIHDIKGGNDISNQEITFLKNCSFSCNTNEDNVAKLVVDNALSDEIVEIVATDFQLLFN